MRMGTGNEQMGRDDKEVSRAGSPASINKALSATGGKPDPKKKKSREQVFAESLKKMGLKER